MTHLPAVIDLHFVTPGLAVGASFGMDMVARLAAEHGVSRVIDVRAEDCDDSTVLESHGIAFLHLPTCDTRAAPPAVLNKGVAFAQEGLRRGESVLIHCQYGIGRSALLTLCVLVAEGWAPIPALAALKAARPVVSPSPDQLQAFAGFVRRAHVLAKPSWEVPSLAALGRIAWSHLRGSVTDADLAEASTSRG